MNNGRNFSPGGPIRGLAYRLLWASSNLLTSAANACLYLAAGLLRRGELDAASTALWRDFYADDDGTDFGLDRWERRLYTEQLRPGSRVLLVGAGTGRDLLGLADLGFDISGLEPVPELLAVARDHVTRRGIRATLLPGTVQTADLGGQYDGIVFSPGVYSCLLHAAERIATVRRLGDHLAPEGRLLVSYCAALPQRAASRWLTRLSARLAGADWKLEPGDVFARDRIASRVLRYEHLFLPGEVAAECGAAGLGVLRDRLESPPFHCLVAAR